MCVCPELSTKPHGPEPRSEAALPPGLEGREGPLLPTRVKLDCRDSLPAQAGLASVLPLPNRAHPDEVRVGAWGQLGALVDSVGSIHRAQAMRVFIVAASFRAGSARDLL